MERLLTAELIKWKESPFRKPLLLLGARQVGKTWLMQDFAASHYKNKVYIRFDRNVRMREIFESSNYEMEALLTQIQMYAGSKIEPGETLIILDEIQECAAALTSLKYFCEDLPHYHVMAAGSLLGVYDHYGTGFPVGKVNTLTLYPLTYCEFLTAMGCEMEVEMLRNRRWDIVKNFSDRYTQLLKLYYYMGGMPEVVNTYLETKDLNAVRRVQRAILSDYEKDFSKHVPKALAAKLFMIWESVPEQLAKENKRFVYGDVKKGLRSRDLEDALDWLRRAGLVERVNRINSPSLPISAYKDGAFKLYFVDVGLLAAKVDLPVRVLLEKTAVFSEFKGALTEQYVQQQLRAECAIEPLYWRSDSYQAEVDFAFQRDMNVVPVEVKAETNTKAKSLLSYCRKYQPKLALRCSMNDYNRQMLSLADDCSVVLLDVPLYALVALDTLCNTELPTAVPTFTLPE